MENIEIEKLIVSFSRIHGSNELMIKKLRSLGRIKAWQLVQMNSAIEKEDLQEKSYKRFVFRDDRLIGAMFVNEMVDPGIMRYLIEKKISIKNYKDLLLKKTRDAGRWLKFEDDKKRTGIS